VDSDSDLSLWIGGEKIIDHARASGPIGLKAGQLYDVRLEYAHTLAGKAWVELMWSSPSTPKSDISPAQLYPQSIVDAFSASFSLLHKVALLVTGLKLSVKEAAYLSANGDDFANLDWGGFPLVTPKSIDTTFFQQWERLYDLTPLRASLPAGAALVDVFAAAS